jgi:hypothetical protein
VRHAAEASEVLKQMTSYACCSTKLGLSCATQEDSQLLLLCKLLAGPAFALGFCRLAQCTAHTGCVLLLV